MADVGDRVRTVMEAHWREVDGFGFTVPNATVYPWQWLWDSCFHAIIWAELGRPDRAVRELESLFAHQDDDGFVPHVIHHGDPDFHADFWGRSGTSSVTQPPMYGHAIDVLRTRGIDVPGELVERAEGTLRFLLEQRARSDDGLVTVVHPWETGADNSPRWDDWCRGGFDVGRWHTVKGELMTTIERTPGGAPVANPAFPVGSIGFNALVAFNARELGVAVDDLVAALDRRWNEDRRTWVDGPGSGSVRTVDALLPLLLGLRPEVGDQLTDRAAFGAPFGPTGVHRDEPVFAPRTYWRGPTWPQLAYLLWVAGVDIARPTVAGAEVSGLAEYWDPDDGTGLGAIPQSWTGLALVMSNVTGRG
jgi:glycogen debranching enzyme